MHSRTHIYTITVMAALALTGALVMGHPPLEHAPPSIDSNATVAEERTVAFLETRLAQQPADTVSLSKLAALRLRQARRSGTHADLLEADLAFRRLLEIDSNSAMAQRGLAYSLLGRHRFSQALNWAREAAFQYPDSSDTWALLGDIHFALGNYPEAEAFFARLADRELTFNSLSRLALIHQVRGRFHEADVAFHEALEAGRLLGNPATDLAWCHTMIGEFDASGGALDEAVKHYQAAIELSDDAHAAQWRLARVYLSRGLHAQASSLLRPLVERFPKPVYLVALGDVCAAVGDADEALRWYQRAEQAMLSEIDHGDVGHVRDLVEFWLSHDGDVERAVELAIADVRDVRRDVGAFETAAWALYHANRTDEAVKYIHQALRRSTADARTLARAALILDQAGRDLESKALMRRAIKRNPTLEVPARSNVQLSARDDR